MRLHSACELRYSQQNQRTLLANIYANNIRAVTTQNLSGLDFDVLGFLKVKSDGAFVFPHTHFLLVTARTLYSDPYRVLGNILWQLGSFTKCKPSTATLR